MIPLHHVPLQICLGQKYVVWFQSFSKECRHAIQSQLFQGSHAAPRFLANTFESVSVAGCCARCRCKAIYDSNRKAEPADKNVRRAPRRLANEAECPVRMFPARVSKGGARSRCLSFVFKNGSRREFFCGVSSDVPKFSSLSLFRTMTSSKFNHVDTPCGTRTRNLRIRSPTPCPLGQGGNWSCHIKLYRACMPRLIVWAALSRHLPIMHSTMRCNESFVHPMPACPYVGLYASMCVGMHVCKYV